MKKSNFLGALLLLIYFCFCSCNQEDVLNSKNENVTGGMVEIKVSVDGVEEFKEAPETRANEEQDVVKHWFPLGDTCWIQATVIPKPIGKKVETKAVLSNIRFRLVALDTKNTEIKGQAEYITGDAGIATPVGAPLVLPVGSYNFYFFSYGKNEPIDAINALEFGVSEGHDILHASIRSQNISGSSFNLSGVKFTHSMSNVKVVVNSLLTKFNITECSATMSGLPEDSGLFSLINGSIRGNILSKTGSKQFSFPSLGTGVAVSQSHYLFPQSISGLSLKFDELNVGDNYSGLTITMPSSSIMRGFQHEIHIKIMPYGIPLTYGSKTYNYAPGILKRDGDKYYIVDIPAPTATTADGGTFFTEAEAAANPCQHVGAKWVLPETIGPLATGTGIPPSRYPLPSDFTATYSSVGSTKYYIGIKMVGADGVLAPFGAESSSGGSKSPNTLFHASWSSAFTPENVRLVLGLGYYVLGTSVGPLLSTSYTMKNGEKVQIRCVQIVE